MELLQHRCTLYHKSHRGLAQQTEVESLPWAPNFYTLISTFKDIQAANEATIIQRNAGGTIRPKAKRYRDIYSRLIQLKDRPTSGRIDVVQYSDAASH